MIPQLIEDLLLLPQAVSRGWLAAGCWLRSAAAAEIDMDQLGGIIDENDPRPLRTVCAGCCMLAMQRSRSRESRAGAWVSVDEKSQFTQHNIL
jgi:hypothetical protein